LESISSSDGTLCVDFFEDPAGGYGFEHLRADPEDRGRWTAVGNYGGLRYATASEAVDAAEAAIVWLTGEAWAGQRLDAWRSQLTSEGSG
jgi:hypothetical protein